MTTSKITPAIRLYQIDYALRDIATTLALYRDEALDHPYVKKLYGEWDSLLDEKRRLLRARPIARLAA
jgi:hypothetical protein